MYESNSILCERANRLHLTMLTYSRASVDTSWQGTVCNSPFSFLYHVIKGHATIECEYGTFTLSEGNWYLIPSRLSFSYRCEDFMDHVYFHIMLHDIEHRDFLQQCRIPLATSYKKFPDFVLQNLSGKKDILTALATRNFLYETVLAILTENKITLRASSLSPVVHSALSYINANLSAELTTEEIAKQVFVSKSTLTKHFKNELSVSVQEYLYDVILSEASRMLLKDNRSIFEISQKLGFSDQFYFSRRFKEKYGVSPREFKKMFI